jgi:chromosomal replication initiator protein
MNPLQSDIITMRETIAAMLKTLDLMERKIEHTPLVSTGIAIAHIQAIFRIVCEHYKIPETAIHLRTRITSVVLPRHVAMFITREITSYSLRDIANCFREDMRTHTVAHGCKRIIEQMEYDLDLLAVVAKLSAECSKQLSEITP